MQCERKLKCCSNKHSFIPGVESRARDLTSEVQTKHQQEIDRIQQISNEAHQNSQQLLHDALQENQRSSKSKSIYLTNEDMNKEKCVQ